MSKNSESEVSPADREEKLERLKDLGIDPYPYDYDVDTAIGAIVGNFEAYDGKQVSIAGRLTAFRKHGGAVFADLRGADGDIQIYLKKNVLTEVAKGRTNVWEVSQLLDISDLVGVKGTVFKTRMGEMTVKVEDLEVLSKSLHSVPFGKLQVKKPKDGEQAESKRWYAAEDPEIRYRDRFIYWNVYPEERKKVEIRIAIMNTIREFMKAREFLEVETPTIEMIYGGAEARPFETELWALGHRKAYLRISPELYLKRFIVGGFPKVFTICKNFRNEGIDKSHNPEFMMMEWYEAYTDYEYQMKQVEDLVSHVTREICGSHRITYQGTELNFQPPWKRLRMVDAVKEHTGFDAEAASEEDIKTFISDKGLEYKGRFTKGLGIAFIFDEFCEEHLVQPTFIIDHPVELSPLTKVRRGHPGYVERFEPYVLSMELGNGYSELTDPAEQMKRFKQQRELRWEEGIKHHPVDLNFVKALRVGMPPTGGVGLGIDRLIMLLADAPSLRDIIPFPLAKAERAEDEPEG
jgi:lysyl-tRNA synthetase class 2